MKTFKKPNSSNFEEDLSADELLFIHQQQNKRLLKELEILHSTLDFIQEGVVIIDRNGEIYYHNKPCREMLGFSDLHTDTTEEKTRSLWRYAPEIHQVLGNSWSNEGVQIHQVSISYPEKRTLKVYILPFLQEELPFFVFVLNDITREQEKHENEMEQERFSAIQLLAGSIAHEIGNPLNALQIHLQLLQRQLQQQKKLNSLTQHTQTCLEELQRLDGIVKCFLQAMKPVRPVLTPLHVESILNYCLSTQKPELEALNIQVEVLGEFPSKEILGDETQLKQVFFNLLRNAMDAMDRGGHLKIEVQETPQTLRIRIEDDGKGIPEDAIPHLFEPYYTTKSKGNGLGLLIVERIIKAHHGTLSVECLHPHGTAMIVQLPLKSPQFPMLEREF